MTSRERERWKRFHAERVRLSREGQWTPEAKEALRAQLFAPRPRIRLGEVGRR